MTPNNIIAGFNVTGVYPFNRHRVDVPEQVVQQKRSFNPESLAEKTGLAYIPLYSPAKRMHSKYQDDTTTSGERASSPSALEISYSEGDIANDLVPRVPYKRATSVTRFLKTPQNPNKLPTKHQKSAGKVLTSLENMLAMEEKERKTEELLREKEKRKQMREAKAKERLMKKNSRAGRKGALIACVFKYIIIAIHDDTNL